MKKGITLFLLALMINQCFSQALKDKMIHSWGWVLYTDALASPVKKVGTEYYQGFGYSGLTFLYRLRYNVKEFDDNKALSIDAVPAFGFALTTGDDGGFGYFNLPIIASMNFGVGATYNSSADKGGFVGLGLEYFKCPLVGLDVSGNYKSSWVQPVFSTGYRYWNRKNKLKEVNLKIGAGLSSVSNPNSELNINRSFAIRLAWIRFINY